MNTEKSIKLMKVIKEILPEHFNFDFGKEEIEEIVKRLQMWDDFKGKYNGCYLMVSQAARGLNHLMNEFEEEYFPKLVKKTITIEIEANNENVIKWAEHEIKDLENNVWNHKIKVNTKEIE